MRRYPDNPIVGVGAIITAGDSILLVRRGNPPNKGLWGVPGGCLELGESLREGLAREVREECGIEVKVGELFDIFEVLTQDDQGAIEFHYVLLDFFAEHVSGELRSGSDADECKFVPFDSVWEYNVTPCVAEAFERIKQRGIF